MIIILNMMINKFLLLEKIINKNLVNKECLKEFREYNNNKIEEIITKIKNGSVDYKKIFLKMIIIKMNLKKD